MSERIADIRRRLEAATAETPEPWEELAESGDFWLEAANGNMVIDTEFIGEPYTSFIAHAPADIRYLLEQLALRDAALDGARELQRQLSEEVKRLTAEVEARKAEW